MVKLFGTIANGHIRLDQPADLPDGTRIVILPADEYEDLDDFGELGDLGQYEYPHPMAPYDPVKEAALIRERMASVAAGAKTIPWDVAIKQIREQLQNEPHSD